MVDVENLMKITIDLDKELVEKVEQLDKKPEVFFQEMAKSIKHLWSPWTEELENRPVKDVFQEIFDVAGIGHKIDKEIRDQIGMNRDEFMLMDYGIKVDDRYFWFHYEANNEKTHIQSIGFWRDDDGITVRCAYNIKNLKRIKEALKNFDQDMDELLAENDTSVFEINDEPDLPTLTIHVYLEGFDETFNVQELSKLYQRITKKAK